MVAPHYDFLIKLLLIGDSGESTALDHILLEKVSSSFLILDFSSIRIVVICCKRYPETQVSESLVCYCDSVTMHGRPVSSPLSVSQAS